MDPTVLEEWKRFGEQYFLRCFRLLHENGHTQFPVHCHDSEYLLGLGAKSGFKELVMRSPGRYELSLLDMLDEVPDIKRIVKKLEPLLPKFLGGGYKSTLPLKLCHVSLLVSTPGATDQGWHADGGHASLHQHLPCHCANVFVPLHDLPVSTLLCEICISSTRARCLNRFLSFFLLSFRTNKARLNSDPSHTT